MDSSLATSVAATATRPKPREMSAEFARLYYFFEKLTQPRNLHHQHHQGSTSRKDSESTTAAAATATADGSVPEDIVPLLKNLSVILTKDERLDGDGEDDGDGDGDGDAPLLGASDDDQQVCIPDMPTTASASTFATHSLRLPPSFHPRPASASVSIPPDHASTRPRRNTVAASALASASEGTGTTQTRSGGTRFPLREKRYPFTFKLMLHKLYDLEDWAAKVQEVLATSQEQFRPLNSTSPHHHHDHQSPPATGIIISGGRGDSSSSSSLGCDGSPCSPRSPGTTFSGSLFGSPSPSTLDSPTMMTRRRRSQSTSKVKASNAAAGGAATPSRSAPPPAPSRAVKKRIVNRRRSTNGLGEGMVGKMGEWTYDAAVSSVDAEQAEARGQDSLRRRKRVISSIGFAEERRFAGRDVTNLNVSL
jgi:hypothetical protein